MERLRPAITTPSRSGSTLPVAAVTTLAPIAWGTTYVTVTEWLPADRPLLIASLRVVPAALVLLAAGLLVSRWRPHGSEWARTGLLALFNFGIFFPMLVTAVYRLPGGVAAAVGGIQPLLVAAMSWVSTRRGPRRLDLAVGAIAALGVGLVVLRPDAALDTVGILAAVVANVSFAIAVVLTKRFPTPPNRVAATGWQLLMGSVALVPLTLMVEGTPPALSGRNLAGFAYLSVIATAIPFVLWFNGIRRLPAGAPPLLGLAAPITGATLGWALLGESLSPLQLTGFVVTILAIAYGAWIPAENLSVVPEGPHRATPNAQRRTPNAQTGERIGPHRLASAELSRGSGGALNRECESGFRTLADPRSQIGPGAARVHPEPGLQPRVG